MNYREASEQICLFFEETEEVMLEMEQEINNLYTCSPDDMEVSVYRIESYRELIDEILADIDSVCETDDTGELKKAVSPKADRKDILPELSAVFEKRQDINAVIFRMQNIIPLVQGRLKKSMEKTLEEIKENNSGQSAKAARYYDAVSATQEPSRLSRKIRSI